MQANQIEKQRLIEQVMLAAPVIPVVTVDDPKAAVAMAAALVAGGLKAIEITLRTPRALECLAAVASSVDGAIAGAGTILNGSQMAAVENAGARFMVSPGATSSLLSAASGCGVPLLPGASSASEMMALGEAGYHHLKFFPAGASGGLDFLKSVAGPLPDFRICPTGGVHPGNAADYLALANVLCVGGSWVTPPELIARGDWDGIEALASKAARIAMARG